MNIFKAFKLKEDVAVSGEVAGMGDVVYPSEGSSGSGDSFELNSDKNKIIQKILQTTNQYTKSDLYLKDIDDLYNIYKKLNEEEIINMNTDPDSDDTDVSKKEEPEEEIISRLDQEAIILAKTDKTEEELDSMSDDEILAMYKKLKD